MIPGNIYKPQSSPCLHVLPLIPATQPQEAGKLTLRFLELCVNVGLRKRRLAEIEITYMSSDGELFSEIRKRYKNLRNPSLRYSRLSLRHKLTRIVTFKFVKVSYSNILNRLSKLTMPVPTRRSTPCLGHTRRTASTHRNLLWALRIPTTTKARRGILPLFSLFKDVHTRHTTMDWSSTSQIRWQYIPSQQTVWGDANSLGCTHWREARPT